jgi:nucleoside-diphosphate-sugar epimerase
MKTLVLGGSVFVGRHLVEELHRRGHDVAVLNRGQTPAEHPPGVERVTCDRRDRDAVGRALGERRFDAVFDVSAYVPDDVSTMIDVFRDRLAHYVFTSTIAVFSRSDYLPLDEDSELDRRPQANPYTAGKVGCEDRLMAAHRESGFPVTIIRPNFVYGPHNPLLDREASFFLRLRRGRKVLVPGNGSTLHQCGHVDDLAVAFASVLGKDEVTGQAYNVTAEKSVTYSGYVNTLAQIVGVEPQIVYVPLERMRGLPRPFWPYVWQRNLITTVDRAKCQLDWSQRYDFEAGHRHTYEWFQREGLADKLQPDFAHEDELLAELEGGS